MNRMSLLSRPKTAEKEQCLPAGDGLPLWSEVPLYAKLPVYPTPKGSYKLCTTSLCEPKHKLAHIDFDLTDPCGHLSFSEYEPLHDPHLRNHFNVPRMRRHLVRNGFLYNGKVVCNLKEFNKYRQYLRKMFLLELEYNKQKQECLREAARSDLSEAEQSVTRKRLERVRKRMEELKSLREQRYEKGSQMKSEKRQRRMKQMESERLIRETLNRHAEKKRKHTLQQHKQMIERRNKLLMRRWNMQERQRQRRLSDARQKRLNDHRRKIQESWDTRIRNQQLMINRDIQAQRRIDDEKSEGIATLQRRVDAQRQRLKDELESIRNKKKLEQEENERKHAQRLAERLALADIRNMARRNARRRGKPKFLSMWGIMSSLRRMEFQDIKEQQSQRLLNILADACDDMTVLIEETSADDWEDIVDEEEYLHLKAREIVMNVYEQVKQDLMPKADEDSKGHISFRSRASVIPGGSNEIIDRELKSVEEHVLTPVPSAYELEAIRLVEAKEDEMIRQEEMKLAETLLQRLLADVNDKKLERDEIVKLTEYCVEVVQRKDYQKAVENDVETKDLNEYQVSGIADKLVKFTLEHLLDDIKSGGVSHEDLTKLTVSVVGNKKYTDDYPDKQIDQFAENTLQDITEEEPRSGSPENEIILNEFIVKTIKTLADDVERGRLSKEIIEDMLSLLTAEMGDHLTQEAAEEISLKSVLHKIIADLENDKSESLYRVVHAFVSSYLNYRESSQESLEDLVKTVIERARAVVSTDQDAIESLSKLAEEMSSQSLSSAQISSIANEVIKATSPEERSLSEVARTIVEEAISSAREIVMQATPSDLSTIASSLTTSINSVLHEPTTEVLKREDPFTNSVAMFVTDVLNVVFKNMEKGYFTETDICDMMNSVKTILHTRDDKDKILADHIKCILSDVSSGEMNDTELQNVGQELIHCGRRLLGKPSKQSRMTPSFTSTAIADDVTGHLFQSLQELFQKGEISKEALKELTQCILRSGSSVSLTASGKLHGKSSTESLLAKLSTTKYPSPCDSRIAEEVVRCTVDQIKRDIDDGKLSKFSMISMASSAISLFSGVENRSHDLNTLLNSILDKLREEKLTIKEVKALFRAIVRKYQYDLDVMFTDRELTSADSQLAETLIRETITKIDRDIRSGNITNEDMMLFADETKRSGKETPSDVINLVLSVIQHLKRQVIDNMADENLMRFLEVIDAEHSNEIKEGSGITKSVDLIWCDIALNRHSSIYLKRILENYVTQQGTEGQIMVLGDIMQTMNIGVLSHFVKMTVAEVLSDIRKQRIQSGGVTVDTALSETGRLIQTASSIVANKLVQNLLNRIEKTVLIGKTLSSDQELVPLHSESRHGGQTFANFENELLMRISSNEIGGHILETLNNIISNMRLERSIDRFHHLAGDDAHKRMSSGVIEDFVLETLQDIVESMQDHLSLNELQDTQQMLTDASKTSIFVMDAVNNILKEMSEEIKAEEQQRKQETSMSVERDTSTASLEAEAVVVGTLHTIIQDFIGDEDTTQITVSNFKFDKEPKTGTVIGTLQSLKRDIGTPNNAAVRDAVTDIIQSTVEDGKQKEDDNFIEDTIDMIIHTLERNKLKPNDSPRRYSNSSLETDDTLELLVVPADGSDTILLDGRALSLQKMAEMTSKMLKLYEENPVSPYHSGQELVGHISTEKVAELISEAVSKTLSNIETGILSEKEIHDLANVLSEIFPVETLEESGQSSDHQKASAFDEKSVENFVMAALEKAKQELVCGSLDEEKIIMAVQSITHVHRHGSDTQTSKRSSLTSMSSEMLTKLVKSVLSNIANAFSNEDLAICDDTKKKQGSTKSMSSQTSASSFSSSSTKKGNVNPNATNRLLSAHSSEYVEHQKKTTPVPTLQSFCDVTNTRTCYVNGFAQQKTHDFYEETLGNKKPTCMVAPQKAIPKTPKKNKRNVNVGSTYVGRRDVRRDSPLPVSRHTTQNRASVTHETPANQRQHRSNDGANNNPARSITRPILHPNTQAQQLPPERAVSVQNRPTPSIGSTREITSKRRSVSSMNSSETTSPNMKNQATASKKTTQTRPNTLSKSIVSGTKESAQLRSLMPDKVVKVPLRTSKISGDKHTPKSQKQGSVKSKTNTESPLKSEPAEVRSLCGSHKTKITVRRNSDGDNDQLDLRSSHFN